MSSHTKHSEAPTLLPWREVARRFNEKTGQNITLYQASAHAARGMRKLEKALRAEFGKEAGK